MRLNALPRVARATNWILAGILLAAIIGGVALTRETMWLGGALALLQLLLLVGVLFRLALAYIGIITLALFSMAGALNREDLLTASVAAVTLAVALYVRSQLAARSMPAVSDGRSEQTTGGSS